MRFSRRCACRSQPRAILVGGVLLLPATAGAYSVEVDASIIGQGYSLNTADLGNVPAVDRRRLTSYLGLQVAGLGRKDADGFPTVNNQFSVTIELRVDADFGDYLCNIGRSGKGAPLGCLDPQQGGIRTDPELSNYRPELLFAYVEGRNLFGWLDVRLGRQIIWDLFDLRGLDGGWVRVRTPIYLALEAFAGVSENGAQSIDSPVYALDGSSRTLRYAPDDSRQQFAALEPTVGASLLTSGLPDIQGRLSYRRTFSDTQDLLAPGCMFGSEQPCAPTSGVIEERLSYTLHGRFLDGRLHAFGGLRYDFLSARFDDGQLGVRTTPWRGHSIAVEYRYSAPTWDGDSIFNVFASEPYHQVQASYDGRTASDRGGSRGQLSWHVSAFSRLFHSNDSAPTDAGGFSVAVGGDAGIRYRRPHGFVGFDGYCDGGYGGLRGGANVSGRLLVLRDTVGLEGRAMYIYWADDQRSASQSHGMSLQAGVRWAILRGALLHVVAEENVDRFYNSQLRLMAILDLSFVLGPNGGGRLPPGLLGAGFGDFSTPGGALGSMAEQGPGLVIPTGGLR